MADSEDKPVDGDTNDSTEAGTALTPAGESGIGPFIAAAEESAAKPRGLAARLLDYSAHAAIALGVIGFAWTVGSHLGTRPTAAQIEAPTTKAVALASTDATPRETKPDAAKPDAAKAADIKAPETRTPVAVGAPVEAAKADELKELRRSNAQMAADIKSLRANLDSLRNAVKQDKTSGDVRALEADVKSVKSGLNDARSEADTALAELSDKVEKLQHDRAALDQRTTGSIAARDETNVAKAVPLPPNKPASARGLASLDDTHAADEASKPQVIAGWVVRDVYDGVALIEGRRGPMEVVPGVSVPGAGVVKSIDRHGNGWTVTTTKGLLAFSAPPRDFRRAEAHRLYEDDPRY